MHACSSSKEPSLPSPIAVVGSTSTASSESRFFRLASLSRSDTDAHGTAPISATHTPAVRSEGRKCLRIFCTSMSPVQPVPVTVKFSRRLPSAANTWFSAVAYSGLTTVHASETPCVCIAFDTILPEASAPWMPSSAVGTLSVAAQLSSVIMAPPTLLSERGCAGSARKTVSPAFGIEVTTCTCSTSAEPQPTTHVPSIGIFSPSFRPLFWCSGRLATGFPVAQPTVERARREGSAALASDRDGAEACGRHQHGGAARPAASRSRCRSPIAVLSTQSVGSSRASTC